MSKYNNLHVLVQSLSRSEKRYFRLSLPNQDKKTDYVTLFNLMEESGSIEQVRTAFKMKCPRASFDNNVAHLSKTLSRSLRAKSSSRHIDMLIPEYIMDFTIMKEKEIYPACFEILEKAISLASEKQAWFWMAILFRKYLELFTESGIRLKTEPELVNLHQEVSRVIEKCLEVHEHAGFYELVLSRSTTSGHATPGNLDDLAIAEHQLVSRSGHLSYEAKKFHLLFQSVYFKQVNDQQSTLKVLFELNELFENHRYLWNDPPVHYIQHVKRMLFSLIELGKVDETGYFINRLLYLVEINEANKVLVWPVVYIFQLLGAIRDDHFEVAREVMVQFDGYIDGKFPSFAPVVKAEVLLVRSIALFRTGDIKGAVRALLPVSPGRTAFEHLVVYRVIRLFVVICRFMLKQYDLMLSEIRSQERFLKKNNLMDVTEKELYRFLRRFVNTLSYTARKKMIVAFLQCIKEVKQSGTEPQMHVFFDLEKWAGSLRVSRQ